MSFTGVISPLQVEFLGPYLLVRFSPTSTHTTDLEAFFGGAWVEVVGQKMKSLSKKLSYYIFLISFIFIYLYIETEGDRY